MRYFAALAAFLLFAATATPAAADNHHRGHGPHGGAAHDGRGHGPGHGPMMRHRLQPLGRILGGIRRHHAGRLSDVRGPWPGPRGEPHYHVKWLTPEGRVLWLDVDAQTGQVVSVEGVDNRRRDR